MLLGSHISLASLFAIAVWSQESSFFRAKNCPIFTFEDGLNGWTKDGTAFIHQPVFSVNKSSHGHQGNWLIDTYKNMTTPCQDTYSVAGGKPTGTMTSPLFLIRSSSLSFLIGGGCDQSRKIRMELLVDGSTVGTRTGKCRQHKMTISWISVQEHRGKHAQVRLVDQSEVDCITFDDLRHGAPCKDLDACVNGTCEIPNNDLIQNYVCSCPSHPKNLSSCGSSNTCPIPHGSCSLFCDATDCRCIRCRCASGYLFNRNTLSCEDFDECNADKHDCKHMCNNTEGSFQCYCLEGYTLDSDQKSCSDMDECKVNNGRCEHTCVNSLGSYYCRCKSGWLLNADNRTCDDKNECKTGHDCEQLCVNSEGSYYCSCRPGYVNTTSKNCKDINECSFNNSGCQSQCTNNEGSFECSCDPGFQLGNDKRSCLDIDECSTNTAGCQQRCNNLPGKFHCSCDNGYQLHEDNTSCIDIDECAFQHQCHQQCSNFDGGYNCSCFRGYKFDEKTKKCLDVDECLHGNGNCSQICINTPGSYNCSCTRGYQLLFNVSSCDNCSLNNTCKRNCLEWICKDVNECQGTHACAHTCINTDGSFECVCDDGYFLDDDRRSCVRQENESLEQTLKEGQQQIYEAANIVAVVKATKHISNKINNSRTMKSHELNQTLEVLGDLAEKIKQFNTTETEAKELIKGVSIMISSLMGKGNQEPWKQLAKKKGTFPAEIPKVLEDVITAVVHSLDKNSSQDLHIATSTANLEIYVNTTARQKFKGTVTPTGSANKVTIPSATVKDKEDNASVAISVALLKGMENILSSVSNTGQANSSEMRLNSIIITVMVINVNPEYLRNLKEPILLRFEHLEQNVTRPKCSFLNHSVLRLLRENKMKNPSKQWSSEGCKEHHSTAEFTVCKCYHLTSYGLIMDVHNVYVSVERCGWPNWADQ